jgi:hypothetical protein
MRYIKQQVVSDQDRRNAAKHAKRNLRYQIERSVIADSKTGRTVAGNHYGYGSYREKRDP